MGSNEEFSDRICFFGGLHPGGPNWSLSCVRVFIKVSS